MRNSTKASVSHNALLKHLSNAEVWNTELAFQKLNALGWAGTKRTAERRLHELGLWPEELSPISLKDEFDRPLNLLVLDKQLQSARSKRKLILFTQLHTLSDELVFIHANNAKGGRYWIAVDKKISEESISKAIEKLLTLLNKPVALFPHGKLTSYFRTHAKLQELNLLSAYKEPVEISVVKYEDVNEKITQNNCSMVLPPHLARLEAESIFIFREAIAQANKPVMLYSIGKDSSVMLELAKKAFFPSKLPFPLLHIDTRWKFQAMCM